ASSLDGMPNQAPGCLQCADAIPPWVVPGCIPAYDYCIRLGGILFATDSELSIGSGLVGQLTTHVLDTSAGLPAGGVRIELQALNSPVPTLLANVTTGKDGRCPAPLLAGAAFQAG